MLSHRGILPLYCQLQATICFLPIPLPSVHLLNLTILLPLVREHIRVTGFHNMDNYGIFRRLLWAGGPCVHSLWHDPEVTTEPRCRFGACVVNPIFACHKLRPLNETSPFDSPFIPFPGRFVSLGSVLLCFVLWALHKSVNRDAHQSRDALNG